MSSFKTREEADAFAEELRMRGHKAYVLEAKVPGRGTWYRVRVGPVSDTSRGGVVSLELRIEGARRAVHRAALVTLMSSLPLWAIGLLLAMVAPFLARAVTTAFDAHARKRSEDAIARARK